MAGNYKHGFTKTRLYNIWKSMRQRCKNPKCLNYKNYGGKGISVCNEWDDFKVFSKWALKNGYTEELTLDRIDVKENYNPLNCRWVSYKIQENNKTSNRYLELNGEIHTLAEWSDITGIKIGTIHARLKRGWNVEKALTLLPIVGRNQFN